MSIMALIAGLEIPPELLLLFQQLLRVNDQRRYGSIARKGHFLSREAKLKVSTRSLLPQISAYWAGLSTDDKNDWKAAGDASNYNPWNLFVQDTAYRLKFGISGLATPSILHQYKVGKLTIAAPASQALLIQYHPISYYVQHKIRGSKALYEDIKITEQLVLPLTVGLSFKTDLTATSGSPIAEFYAQIYSSYQGRTIQTKVGFDFDLSTDWDRQTIACTEVIGVARFYDLFLHFVDVRGDIYWDNLLANHTGTNYARDARSTDVNNELTRSNYQIEKSWEESILPNGAAFDSVYPPD